MFKHISLAVLFGAACMGQTMSAPPEFPYPHPTQPQANSLCRERNAYYPIEGNCDAYVECKDYSPGEMLCPDGLHYNPTAVWPEYPCSYPMDTSCSGRGTPQPAKPTADCPHQYGFFPSPTSRPGDCGGYRMCVEGQAIEMVCPPGLAFNPESSRCDWPDLVPTCKAEEFLGFQCPAAPLGDDGEPLEIVNYKYEGNCYAFYSCEHGRPRLLTCDVGYAFDAAAGRCVDEARVNCGSVPLLRDMP